MNKLFQDKVTDPDNQVRQSWSLSSLNYIVFGAGIFIIILGYILMSSGSVYSFQSLTIAPLLLFIGYIILIPASLIIKVKNRDRSSVG